MRSNKFNYMSKTMVSLILVASMFSTSVVHAEELIKKDESVYVTLTKDGKVQERIVSNWIHNPKGGEIKDKSSLKDIKNIKGEEKPQTNGENLIWKVKDNDVFYQGKTDKELPLDITLEYYLDGKRVTPEEIAGKSGNLKINLNIKNKDLHKVTVNGKEKDIYTPFTAISVLNLPLDTFKNVKVSSGEVISDSNNSIVTFISLPGLKDSLNLDKDLIDLDLKENLEITAEVEKFKLGPVMITATPNLPDSETFKKAQSLSELKDGINELKDASGKIKEGAEKLSDGQKLLAEKLGDMVSGTDKLNSGAKDLKVGAGKLKEGIAGAAQGANSAMSELKSSENQKKIGLITEDQNVNRERILIEDAYFAKDMDTSALEGLMPFMTEQNMKLMGKTFYDYRAVGVSKLITNPILKELKSLYTPENMANMEALLNNVDALNNLDIDAAKLQPLMALVQNMDKLQALMGDLNTLGAMDTSALTAMKPLLENASSLKVLLEATNKVMSVNASEMKGFIEKQKVSAGEFVKNSTPLLDEKNIGALKGAIDKAYPVDNAATKPYNDQLKALVEGYVKLITETKNGFVNSQGELNKASQGLEELIKLQQMLGNDNTKAMLTEASKALEENNIKNINNMVVALSTMQAKLNNAETQAILKNLNATLSNPEIMGELNKINKVLPQVQGMKKTLEANKKNLEMAKKLLSMSKDKEFQATIQKLSVLEEDMKQLSPMIKALDNMSPEVMEKLSKSPESIGKLTEMQKHLKDSEDILQIMKESLEENNINKAREAISKLPELSNGFVQLKQGSEMLYNGVSELSGGTKSLAEGSIQLKEGADALAAGALELKEGTEKFDAEGAGKLHEEVGGKVDEVQEILDTKDEIIKLSENYGTFTGMGDNMEGKVKFIMKTDEIKIPEVKNETKKEVKEEKKGFIQWIKNLFSK